VKDLEFLAGLKLREIKLFGTQIYPKTGNALRGMPLEKVSIQGGLFDLSVLADSPITDLDINQWQFGSLKGIERLRLRRLRLDDSKLVDLAPLAGMPLEYFEANRTSIKDLSLIAKAPLKELSILGCKAPLDVGVLRDCQTLESILLSPHHQNIETLRALPKLQRISFAEEAGTSRPTDTAAEFWAKWDKIH
jgi:Leucine-rich repeat (LRR) protein